MKNTNLIKELFVLLLLQVMGWCAPLSAQIDNTYYFSNLSLKDGLSQLSVLKIYQDSKGYMWFGTRNGLNKYDGNKMVVYKHHNEDSLSLCDNHVTSLIEDDQHCLWIGTSHGLNKLELKTDKITPYTKENFQLLESGVRSLFIDSKDRLWVGTSKGLCLFVREANAFQVIDLHGKIKGEFITAIGETSDHHFLIGTETKGLFVCDLNLKVIDHYSKTVGGKYLSGDNISSIHEDFRKQLWIGTNYGGISQLDLQTGNVISYTMENSKLSTNNIRCLAESEGTLFVGTFDGIYTINLATNTLAVHSNANLEKGNLSHFSIYSICIDNSGSIWIGTYSGGVNYFNKYNNRFSFHEPTNVFNVLLGIYGAMVCKEPNCLYIATEGGGLLDYNLLSGVYRYYLYDTSSHLQYSRNIIKSVMLEGDIVWCGTSQGSIYKFDTRTKKYSLYHDFSKNMSIYSILHASDNSIWVTTSKPAMGLLKLTEDKQGNKNIQRLFTSADSDEEWTSGSSRCMLELRKGVYLIGSRNSGLYKYDENKQERTIYNVDGKGGHKLLNNYVTSIVRSAVSGRLWIGTFGGGISLYDEEKGIVKNITKKQGLLDEDVCAIVEDKAGNLWISTNGCISKYNPETEEINNYNQVSGVGVQEFTPHSGMLLPNGEICFSASNGFITFNPDELQTNSFIPPLVFTDLIVNNKPVIPADNGILTSVLDDTERIDLAYDQNNISIGYCALNYIYANQNQYAYRLKGHDKEWNYVGNRREAYYTNLSPGKYVFKIKAANNDGIWSQEVRTLTIVVHPPFWKTWYAYLFYGVSFFGICFLIMYYIIKKKNLEQALQYKQLEQQRAEEFHQTKIRMFTNFSHELRTPLTLIIAPLQELLQRTDFNVTVKNKLSLIFNNSQRLLLLVNQLMDLRKNQAGKMQLKIAKDDICSFVMEIYYAFNQIAISKNIQFNYENQEERIVAWFDKSLFEKVVFNLLSNAFKYTREGGTITLSVQRIKPEEVSEQHRKDLKHIPSDCELLSLSVSDTGKGIPEEEMKNIFAPFYQIEDGKSKDVVGTGIGLSLTQSIVSLHHGIIWAENNERGGAVFHVLFPIGRSVYTEQEVDSESATRVVMDVIPSTTSPDTFNLEKKYTVLLVEDNEEVRCYVKECLEPYFYVLEADNGETAFEIVVDKYPDIVVSDIMMPKKDGLELCTQIKEDLRTGHIPVILMTAKSMVMHIKEGFSSGADDYIVKPFNMDVLIYRIKNILISREKLKKLYGKKFSPEAIGIEIVSSDDRFTQKFFDVIEKNLANPELNIDLLCKEIGLSRTNLYRKLKAITELSPIELIRNKRLEIAAKLLLESDYSVSEISVYVGFNSHAYFTQCFKLVYGCSPTEFLIEHKKMPMPD